MCHQVTSWDLPSLFHLFTAQREVAWKHLLLHESEYKRAFGLIMTKCEGKVAKRY